MRILPGKLSTGAGFPHPTATLVLQQRACGSEIIRSENGGGASAFPLTPAEEHPSLVSDSNVPVAPLSAYPRRPGRPKLATSAGQKRQTRPIKPNPISDLLIWMNFR